MERKIDLDELLARSYRIEAVCHDGRWVARLPELHLVAEAPGRAEALERLDQVQRALFQAHLDAGTAATLPQPRPEAPRRAPWARAGAVALAVVVVVLAVETVAARALDSLPERALRFALHSLEASTSRARQVSPERQRELAGGLKGFVAAVAPFLDEVGSALPARGGDQRQ